MDPFSFAADLLVPKPPRWATPGELARDLDPTTIQTPALDLIDSALVDVEAGRCDRLMIFMPPQEGKSTRVTTVAPLWFLLRNPQRRIAIVSYAQDLADEFGRNIRSFITDNSGDDDTLDLGLRIAPDNGAARRWRLDGHRGGVRAVGLAGGLTGKAAEALFIDDPLKDRQQADSPTYRRRALEFWRSVGSTRLAPGAPVILIMTRWHHKDLAGELLAAEDGKRWRVINIPAQADHKPDKGETDPLGRKPGEWLQSARKRTPDQWRQIETQAGPRDFTAMYQGKPSPEEGGLFPAEKWSRYDAPKHTVRSDGSRWLPGEPEVIQSWDFAFKGHEDSDYVVGQVWCRYGQDAYLLDQVRDRMDFNQTVQAIKDMSALWPQAVAKFVEDKANGPAIINSLNRTVPGLIPVEPEGSKYARASAVSPLMHSGNVHLPEAALAPWITQFTEEAKGFPHGANDDQVDAFSQAINRLLLMPLMDVADVEGADELLDYERRFAISPY